MKTYVTTAYTVSEAVNIVTHYQGKGYTLLKIKGCKRSFNLFTWYEIKLTK